MSATQGVGTGDATAVPETVKYPASQWIRTITFEDALDVQDNEAPPVHVARRLLINGGEPSFEWLSEHGWSIVGGDAQGTTVSFVVPAKAATIGSRGEDGSYKDYMLGWLKALVPLDSPWEKIHVHPRRGDGPSYDVVRVYLYVAEVHVATGPTVAG